MVDYQVEKTVAFRRWEVPLSAARQTHGLLRVF